MDHCSIIQSVAWDVVEGFHVGNVSSTVCHPIGNERAGFFFLTAAMKPIL